MSHALRHEPDAYGLSLEAQGWVRVDDLVDALCGQGQAWENVDRAAIESMMAAAAKQRFELSGARIRAYYGHSTPRRIEREPATPPTTDPSLRAERCRTPVMG